MVPWSAELELEKPEGCVKLFTEQVGGVVVLEQHINSAYLLLRGQMKQAEPVKGRMQIPEFPFYCPSHSEDWHRLVVSLGEDRLCNLQVICHRA
jgi:hypothetical protein